MYSKTPAYYDTLYHFLDYQAACQRLEALIQRQHPGARTLLDVACGTGKHLEYLQHHYQAQGLDINANLLEVARKRCPQLVFHQADMTGFHLPQTFDVVVCLFSAIGYVQTLENLYKAVRCMVGHLNPGGLLAIEPWFTPDQYWENRPTANFVDQPELKISWMYTSRRQGLTSIFDIHYLVATPQGVDHFTEQHVMGLWTEQQYRQALQDAGIQVQYDPSGLFGRGMYYGLKK